MKHRNQPPTENQLRVWNALDEITFRDRRAPTIREIQDYLGGMSTSTIQRLLNEGVDAGRVATWERGDKATNYLLAWLQLHIDHACLEEKENLRLRMLQANHE